MIDLEQLEYEMGQKIRFAYPIQEPDQSFVDRLHSELEQKISVSGKSIQGQKYSSRNSHWIGRTKLLFSPIAWAAIAIILILSMIWGIKTLIPGVIPGSKHESSPTPFVTQTSLPTEIPPLSIGNAIIYTVVAGDTLSTIESKTKVSVDSLINLNAFVLQANELTPGLQLITGFEGQVPVFYTVQPGDTILGISEMAGISVEDFVSLNRIENYSQGTQTHPVDPQYTLTPGMQVIIGLENANHSKNQGANGDQLILSEVDLNCDDYTERILGMKAPEIEYFNITPQLSAITIEKTSGDHYVRSWEQTAQQAEVAYLAYQLFKADKCNQFLVIIGHKGKESVNVYRWDGERLTDVLKLSGRFLFEGDWMKNVFGDYKSSTNSLFLGELQQTTNGPKNTWILREYQWSDQALKLISEKRKELSGGG